MHLPDGFINNNVAGPLLGAAGAFVGVAAHRVQQSVMRKVAVVKQKLATFPQSSGAETAYRSTLTKSGQQFLWRMVTVGSFIFMIQLVDTPLVTGTPGHMLGSALAALVLGPWAAMVVMAGVLVTQAGLLGDGGIVALGINFLSIGLLPIWLAWGIIRTIRKKQSVRPLHIFGATLLSVIGAAIFVAAIMQFDTTLFGSHWASFIGTHVIIGIAEGGVTLLIIRTLKKKGVPIELYK